MRYDIRYNPTNKKFKIVDSLEASKGGTGTTYAKTIDRIFDL